MWENKERDFNVLTGQTIKTIGGMEKWNDSVSFYTDDHRVFRLSHHQN